MTYNIQLFGASRHSLDGEAYLSVDAQLTNEHAASSYGVPVLVVNGVAYGPEDKIPEIGGYVGVHQVAKGDLSNEAYRAWYIWASQSPAWREFLLAIHGGEDIDAYLSHRKG